MAEESLEDIFEAVLITIREVSIHLEEDDELLAIFPVHNCILSFNDQD